ncbi:MAG: hypothetical protein KAI53_03885 [Candidatus Aenigmarchaeota archaeon]|nr:hypothetical protein [Candidatus Aenigmarchaeota archaeon]
MSEIADKGKHEAGWVTISTDEYDSMKSTLEILSDPNLRVEALEGKEQAKKGKTRKLSVVAKDLAV